MRWFILSYFEIPFKMKYLQSAYDDYLKWKLMQFQINFHEKQL